MSPFFQMRNNEIHPLLNEVKPLANVIDFKEIQVAHLSICNLYYRVTVKSQAKYQVMRVREFDETKALCSLEVSEESVSYAHGNKRYNW